MMRSEPDPLWPVLGFRFAHARQHRGSAGLFTCLADDLLLDRSVSLRVCTGSAMPAERDVFERERSALQCIGGHPAIVAVLDVITQGELEILELEKVTGDVSRGVEPRAAVSAVIRLAGAVETAHRMGKLHGAIEPDNLWCDDAGVAKLAGFTRSLDDPIAPLLAEVSPHTAPEVLLGEPLDEAVDVYGLGSTLYELVAGSPAIRSYPGESPAALSLRVLTGAAASLQRADVPYDLLDVIGWSVAVDRADRPPSAAWLAEELGRIERSNNWPRTRLDIGAHPEDLPARPRGARHRTR